MEINPKLPDLLYKYTSANGLAATLKNASLRFSRPNLFNDLFDTTLELVADFDRDTIVANVLEDTYQNIQGNSSIPLEGTMGRMIRLMQKNFHKMPEKEVILKELRLGVEESLDLLPELSKKFGNEISGFLKTSKICCFSSDSLAPPMWGNYANNLSGSVLGFAPTPGADSFFKLARPVHYTDQRPTLMDQERIIGLLSGVGVTNADAIYQEVLHTKHSSWAYEKEWRIAAGSGWSPEIEVEYVGFHKADLRQVILGTRFDKGMIESVKDELAKYPNVYLFQLSERYKLKPIV